MGFSLVMTSELESAPLYLRTLWRYTNAVIIVIIINDLKRHKSPYFALFHRIA